jgi:hypothetical protein
MGKRGVLDQLTIGRRVAEEESDELASYFVETNQWRRMVAGDVDIVFGPKGSGKSAIYATLLHRSDRLRDQNVVLVSAENPRGAPAFRDLVTNPPASEAEFVSLWKLFVLSLVGRTLVEFGVEGDAARRVQSTLRDAGLLPGGQTLLRTIVRAAREYARRLMRAEALETTLNIDAVTGLPSGVSARITLAEPSSRQRLAGFVTADELLELANQALSDAGLTVWVLFDRLDIAFADSRTLEANGLRALFKVYLDMMPLRAVVLKVFLRNDIWRAITATGFREASHITRQMTLAWGEPALLNLVVRRLLQNRPLRALYRVDEADVLAGVGRQRQFFDRLVPDRVDAGRNLRTFEWLVGRIRDGTKQVAPRELIHLLSRARDVQLEMLERGEDEPPGEPLFSGQALRDALPEVSNVRLEQTIFAEYPESKDFLQALEREKTHQTSKTLAAIWQTTEDAAAAIATGLVELGFFEQRGTRAQPSYWVPFLYRPALGMVQGSAE